MRTQALLVVLLTLLCGVLSLRAQERQELLPRKPAVSEPGQLVKDQLLQPDIPENVLVLERAVDPQTYIVGPGDRFFIIIPAYSEIGVYGQVSAEGTLFIPTLGLFPVAGKPLAEVKDIIHRAAKKKYVEGTIWLTLVDLRYFRVHVLGEVAQPGIYPIRQTYRVSDALDLAGGATDWANLSAIEIRRDGVPVQQVDLIQYSAFGDLRHNPQVLDGDVIYVPRVDERVSVVRVEGRIARPGIYFARPNETAVAFLNRISGASRKEDVLGAVIKRPSAGRSGYTVIPLFGEAAHQPANGDDTTDALVLRNGDILSIPSISDSVYVQGAVFRPGPYPYYPNFLARDYAGMAGATENAAGLNGLRVRHAETGKYASGPDEPVHPGDTVEVGVSSRIVLRDYVQIAATALTQIFTFFIVREALRK